MSGSRYLQPLHHRLIGRMTGGDVVSRVKNAGLEASAIEAAAEREAKSFIRMRLEEPERKDKFRLKSIKERGGRK